jgi:hypothetical protein
MTSSPFVRTGFPLKEDDISESNSSHELTRLPAGRALGVFLGSAIINFKYLILKLEIE